jgi:hypothetical protein
VLPKRVRRLPSHHLGGGLTLIEASGIRARLLGLSLLPGLPRCHALLIPRCSSVHTFGMRFALDVLFLGPEHELLRVERDVRPNRVLGCRKSTAVIEVPAGQAAPFVRAIRAGALARDRG